MFIANQNDYVAYSETIDVSESERLKRMSVKNICNMCQENSYMCQENS